MVKLGNCTSIYEVALTINFITGYLIFNYRDIYIKSIRIILTQTKGEEFSENDNNFILKNGNKFSKKSFNRIKYLFIGSIVASILSVLISFFMLLVAGFNSEYPLSNSVYIISSVIFIIINPMLYFVYKISVSNFDNTINNNDVVVSDYIKNYMPIPIYKESYFQKIKWFIYFKIQYIKDKFKYTKPNKS